MSSALAARLSPQISSRKQPTQARAKDLVAAILDAAVQVLRAEGAARFTTARVAERAGVSVGSLYQYFPNKASILFRLQSDEWRRTSELLRAILQDRDRPPEVRLRNLVHAFLQSECDEAEVRTALGDAAPLYRNAPEADAARAVGSHVLQEFMTEVMPVARAEARTLAAEMIEATLTSVGGRFSETARSQEEISGFADGMADMFTAYIAQIARPATVKPTP